LLPVEIDFATAMSGGKVRATTPAGSVVTLDVPRGADSGHRQRIRGQGRRGRGGAPPGDLVVELHVRSHPYFRREGSDLVLDLPVTILEATRGARIQIPTPDGWVRLRIPEGSRGGERLRLRGRGPAGADGRRGDLYIHLSIRLPEQLDAAARHVERIETLYRGSIRENLEL
jgi:DnaJ-class molecular chaperone